MKKSVMSVEAMVDMYLTYGVEEETWEMLYRMANHGLISRENWTKFYETCKGWAVSEDGNSIVDTDTGKTLYEYNEIGDLVKVA